MQLLFDAPDFTLSYDAANGWLCAVWRGTRPTSASVAHCNLLAEKARLTGSTKVLNDGLQDLDSWGELAKWMAEDFSRALASSGIIALAWVLPHNLRARTDVAQVLARFNQQPASMPVVDTFFDIESACAWLSKTTAASNRPSGSPVAS